MRATAGVGSPPLVVSETQPVARARCAGDVVSSLTVTLFHQFTEVLQIIRETSRGYTHEGLSHTSSGYDIVH